VKLKIILGHMYVTYAGIGAQYFARRKLIG
jgi:hypothetical protein